MLRVRIKTKEKAAEQYKITMKQFFVEYFNTFFSDLNNILSDYHSVQEYACRSKIIEFSSRKLKDLHLLQIFVKGAFLQRPLQLKKFMGEDCASSSMKIVEMADFLALLFENMKTSFIPRPNFRLALQTYIDHKKLLPIGQLHPNLRYIPGSSAEDISPDDFDIIHRMMKIYLIKEDSILNFEIDKGILYIKSEFFTFELALCGDFFNPQWQLYKVQSAIDSKLIENQILKRVNTIPLITKFINFYENRRNAVNIFNMIDRRTGFYQNFTGSIENTEIHGYFKGVDFYCTLSYEDSRKELKNPSASDINRLVEKGASRVNTTFTLDDVKRDGFEFHREIFGPNVTYFKDNMFFSLSTKDNSCFFGEISAVCGIKYVKMSLFDFNGILVGVCGSFQTPDQIKDFILRSKLNIPDIVLNDSPVSPGCFSDFIRENIVFLDVAYTMRNLNTSLLIHRASLYSNIFSLSSKLDVLVIEHDNEIKSIPISVELGNKGNVLKEYLLRKMDLIQIQQDVPKECNIIQNVIGEVISLQVYDITVTISDKIETNIRSLNCDCKTMDIKKGFEYVLNFGVFYKFDLFPVYYTQNKIVFKFNNFVEETVEIYKENTHFLIKGAKTQAITKIPDTFTPEDHKYFIILHKFLLADRFIFLKKALHPFDRSTNSNQIDLDDDRSIFLTQEGIKFKNVDSTVNQEITDVLNSEREIEKYVQEKIVGSRRKDN